MPIPLDSNTQSGMIRPAVPETFDHPIRTDSITPPKRPVLVGAQRRRICFLM